MLDNIIDSYFFKIKTSTRAVLYLLSVSILSNFVAETFSEHENSGNISEGSPVVTKSFLADVNNPINQYLVKFAWGWTFYPLCFLVASVSYNSERKILTRRSSITFLRLLSATFVWYFFAVYLFPLIERQTGVCQTSHILSPGKCRKAGFRWTGFDISGHCFLLTWNSLVIIEELGKLKLNQNWTSVLLKNLLLILLVVWEMMMMTTSVYFHTVPEKIIGVCCAIIPWLILYKIAPTFLKSSAVLMSPVMSILNLNSIPVFQRV